MNRIGLIRAAALGAQEIARRYAAGDLDPEARALAMKGAERYLAAIAAGDIAGDSEVDSRRQACRKCKSRNDETAPGAEAPSSWCGPALKERLDQQPPTCGCLLVCKTLVGSESCPQGRW